MIDIFDELRALVSALAENQIKYALCGGLDLDDIKELLGESFNENS
jgi:hypothetical protein